MKISLTYRFIASVLSLSILIGVSVPTGLHAMSNELCEELQEMGIHMQAQSEHAEDCPMTVEFAEVPEHQHHTETNEDQDLGIVCACSVEELSVKTEAPLFQKVKVKVLAVVQIIAEDHTNQTESDYHAIQTSDSYSQPPIFLANESFLI
ncbi:hypothetical protein [Gracilimonas amylolytica]|uniref:hypothetical protein n=1 Tax=Gracilimonas amylolytica TaxID=1749045 RepID=UPI000CD85782|nr:hypothetical protein [Gracilimonas amylolytica]